MNQLQVTGPTRLEVERSTGRLLGAVRHYEKRLADLGGVYLDEAAFIARCEREGDQVAYWVDDFWAEGPGSLVVGTSVLLPGFVGEEYAMTRGHLHQTAEAGEVYHCISGHGIVLMENLVGESRVVEMTEDTIAYVPGHWIHRSVNVGTVPLVTLFTYDASAGQDYEVVERSRGLSQLVVRDDGGWKLVDNSRYLPRDGRH